MPKLTVEQIELVAQFSDHAFDFPNMTVEEVARKVGVRFPSTPAGRLFRRECQEVFDRERAK